MPKLGCVCAVLLLLSLLAGLSLLLALLVAWSCKLQLGGVFGRSNEGEDESSSIEKSLRLLKGAEGDGRRPRKWSVERLEMDQSHSSASFSRAAPSRMQPMLLDLYFNVGL